MGKNPPSRLPLWTDTVAIMVERGCKVRVCCTGCPAWSDVDLVALAARVGADYSLVDRRCRCRLTPGCPGWNHFYYLLGVYRPLRTPGCDRLWMLIR